LNIFDKWINSTGAILKFGGYYCELQSIIEDAVECGIQQALNDIKKIDGEEI